MQYQFEAVEKGKFGGSHRLEGNFLRVANKTIVLPNEVIKRFFANRHTVDNGMVVYIRVLVDERNQAIKIDYPTGEMRQTLRAYGKDVDGTFHLSKIKSLKQAAIPTGDYLETEENSNIFVLAK